MNIRAYHGRQARHLRGFTLVEIMIALLLGVFIMLGITQVANRNSITTHDLERTGRQIESATYALRIMESDLRSAGFWGERGGSEPDAALPPLCAGLGADLAVAITELGGNFASTSGAMGYPVQGQSPGASCIVPAAGTEFLAIRRASSCALDAAGCEPEADHFYLQVNACFDPDDVTTPTPGTYQIDDEPADLDFETRDCTTESPKYRFLNHVYYVNAGAQLVRASLDATGAAGYLHTPIADGVETLRFQYGLDNDGDGQIDVQTSAPAGTQWADVIMVRIIMMVRNTEPSGGTDPKSYTIDGGAFTIPVGFENHRRQVYSRTVNLHNIAGRRG